MGSARGIIGREASHRLAQLESRPADEVAQAAEAANRTISSHFWQAAPFLAHLVGVLTFTTPPALYTLLACIF